ncbi:HlyD family secretion protein [Rhodoplanes sp. TEM]|uniref:HlyD family secretion protein n=1 Tax=Rhodoplanes tepidamans TaxID=200616 RepID=A0ABT5JDC8_RHOTP|nr:MULTISPECIES: HlyD family secretion protein [Rhodoplanes]MDC7787507.1 HlyD family secretion protein [Rhodoplanes tepidamans]MDC7983902.1 HlyD family secretion protein [Rhodoplanes sp. TEM]MDQ0354340.1 multidrug resistance efflux pump [Rhodoplanes tepidamans]
MLELLFCSLLTILPDYLYRRYRQGKRFGHEITLYSVWFELRWGITTCLMLTVGLITVVFYNHPSTTNVTSFYRTVPILPETNGRVAEVFIGFSAPIEEGAPIFRLDSTKQQAAVETARRQIVEVDAEMVVAKTDIVAAEGKIQEAQGAYQQALDELATKQELYKRNPDIVARRELERLENMVAGRRGGVAAATAQRDAAEARLVTLLPAQKASSEAALAQAEVDLSKTLVKAGVSGRVEQFTLRVGDIVNPLMRPAGILIPASSAGRGLQAGFGQIEAQVMAVGMVAEATCASKPWTIIPMVVTGVQGYIASGQFRGGEQLVDPLQVTRPGTILVTLEPLYAGGLEGVTPGSSCIANAYTSNHEALASGHVGTLRWLALHVVDTVALVHAMILRIQALLLPIQTLVLGGH